MSIQEKVIHALEEMGYKPIVDDDGDVMFRYQMKSLYVLGTQKDDCNFLVVALPQFYEIDEGNEIKALTVCNKLTREMSLAKVFIDRTLQNVTAHYEFYFCDDDCLTSHLSNSLEIIGRIRSLFYQTLKEFDDLEDEK